ncbi:unnamed protein product [Moneuplotes crassus]|uniref:Uncharacterized protein n=1 Tax=Euplotes crassus TaxID=5936 RepID=A0AAD1XLJ3_EUPCR|nr:unnamed protein product [Moneuplotes crassus]
MRPLLAKLLKKDKIVIRKSDNDIDRFRKLKLKQKAYENYVKNAPKNERIADIDPLMLKNYNHDRNELFIDAPHLFKRKNYSKSWFYYMPPMRNDKKFEVNNKRRVIQILVFLSALGIGYTIGLRHSSPKNMREHVEELVLEEQLYYHLKGSNDPENPRKPRPVFLTYYCPGELTSINYMIEVGKAAEKHGIDPEGVKFMYVNSKTNINFFLQKETKSKGQTWVTYSELILPHQEEEQKEELDISNAPFLQKMAKDNNIKIPEEEKSSSKKEDKGLKKIKFETYESFKARSVEGIEAVLMEHGLLDPVYNPNSIISDSIDYNKLAE